VAVSLHGRVSELAVLMSERSLPKSVLQPALLMACDNVAHGLTTSLGFYAGCSFCSLRTLHKHLRISAVCYVLKKLKPDVLGL